MAGFFSSRMAGWVVLGVAFLAALTQVEATNPKLVIKPKGLIKQGDNITITCTVPNVAALEVVRIVRQVARDQNVEISTNGFLQKAFEDTNRYKVAWNITSGELQVQINGITGADGGEIGCVHLSGETRKSFTTIIVHVPPKSVELFTLDLSDKPVKVEEGKISLQQGIPGGLVCKVHMEGSDSKPTVSIMLGEDDVTQKFKEDVVEQDKSHHHGLWKMSYTGNFEHKTKDPPTHYNGKKLTCKASMPHFDAIVATADVEVKFPPKLDCQDKFYAMMGTANVRVTCKANMFPAPSSTMWSWGKKENRTLLMTGEANEFYSAELTELGSDEYEFALVLANFTSAEYLKAYNLEVSNGIGSASVKIQLTEDKYSIASPKPDESKPENEEQGGDPALNSGSYTTPMSLLLLATFVAIYQRL